jgi:hypothetical protein
MILMISNHDLDEAEADSGMPCEQILSPHGRHQLKRENGGFCIDNGAFAKFSAVSFMSLLEREESRIKQCRFVAAPDVVGSARRTCEVFDKWYGQLAGWPIAFVCQDGQESLPIPWDLIAAIFIGGSTEWKMGEHARHCIHAAKVIGKWVHVGRVNTHGRVEYFKNLGADSVDGTGLSRFKDNREKIFASQAQTQLIET